MAATLDHTHVDPHNIHEDAEHDDHGHALSWPEQLRANRLGIWLFCISELFLFVALLAARFYLWRDADGAVVRPELSQLAALGTTSVLLASSYFMIRAEVSAQFGEWKKMDRNLVWTFAFGLLFLIGLFVVEWGMIPSVAMAITGEEHILRPTDGTFGAVFYMMTGMHALHVIIGLVYIGTVIRNGRKGKYTIEDTSLGCRVVRDFLALR